MSSASEQGLSTESVLRGLLAVSLLVALGRAEPAHAERLRVCTFGFHGPEEIAAFEASLPATDFEIVDLSSPGPSSQVPARPGAPEAVGLRTGAPWLAGVCRSDFQCQVVVYSAEFAGSFFGRSGRSLSLQEMEEASCQARCAGIFHAPQEVFLLACNTLATKDEDLRSPEVYLQVLLNHGFDRASAERVVAMRYGPLGPAFRESLRRVFAGVPRVYGFSSVAPTGEYSGPMLQRYFRSVGDYRRFLEQAQGSTAPNRALATAFAGTSLVQTTGLTASEPAAADRDVICTLYDEGQPVARRLEIIRDLMERPDFLAFVPTVQVFIDRHPTDRLQAAERKVFEDVQHNDRARRRVRELVAELDVSALQLELAHFAVHLGWMTRDELRTLAIAAARELLHRSLTSEVVDIMCALPLHEFVGDQFGSDDLPELLFRDPEGIRLISCLSPVDARVNVRLAAALDAEDPAAREWAAHALTRRLPLQHAVLLQVATKLGDPSPDVRERLRWIFRAQTTPLPDDVRRRLELSDPQLAEELRRPVR